MSRRGSVWMGIATAVAVALSACTPGPAAPGGAPAASQGATAPAQGGSHAPSGGDPTAPSPKPLPSSGVFDYQLGGGSSRVADRGPAPDIVVRDSGEDPLPGAYNICYVNGFQTQPDEAESWLKRPGLLLTGSHGRPVVDPEWPDEYILDPSKPAARAEILKRRAPLLTGCARKGYDAVEIDNLDTFERFSAIDRDGAMALAADYVRLAHRHGLSIGQKNAAGLTRAAHRLGFDFAIAEECFAYAECDAYTSVYSRAVLRIEYPDTLAEHGLDFAGVCAGAHRPPLTILRDRELEPVGSPRRRYAAC